MDLKHLIEERRSRAERALDRTVDARVCYEAGYEGFWVARWLEQEMAIETVVLDPASLSVNRMRNLTMVATPCSERSRSTQGAVLSSGLQSSCVLDGDSWNT